MNSYDTLNSASRVSDVMKERAKQREQMLLASQAAALEEGARQRKIDNTDAKANVILDTDASAPFSFFLLPQQHCQPNPLFQQ